MCACVLQCVCVWEDERDCVSVRREARGGREREGESKREVSRETPQSTAN